MRRHTSSGGAATTDVTSKRDTGIASGM